MRKIFVSVAIVIFISSFWGSLLFGQTADLKLKLEKVLKNTDPSHKVYINKASNYLEIDCVVSGAELGYQIPYMKVKILYRYLADSDPNYVAHHHFVEVSCENNETCFLDKRGKATDISAVSFGFISKDDAYTFIDVRAQQELKIK